MANDETLDRIRTALSSVIQGKRDVIELLLVGLLAGGHVLVEDPPGVGKTTLAKALARALAVTFSRVQFTPDLLPTDILGAQVLNPREGTFAFHKGPIFTHVLLADEINRASPRTQSALLEAMSESQATVDGVSHLLPAPFFVLATQNPIDFQGTYPLPEAQLDRFLLRLSIGYPALDAELSMLLARKSDDPLTRVHPVASHEDVARLQSSVREIEVKDSVARYMLAIITATREHRELSMGVSPRGSLALFRASQAWALLAGRTYVTPADVQHLAPHVLAHRLAVAPEARYAGRTGAVVVAEIVQGIRVPV